MAGSDRERRYGGSGRYRTQAALPSVVRHPARRRGIHAADTEAAWVVAEWTPWSGHGVTERDGGRVVRELIDFSLNL